MSNLVDKSFSFLGVDITTQVPVDAETWDAAGGVGDCVKNAIEQHGYRGFATPVRSCFLKAIEGKTGKKPDDKETDNKFIGRLKADGTISAAELQELCAAAFTASGITFMSTVASTGGSRAKVGAVYVEQAEALLKAWEAGRGTPDATLAKIRAYVPTAQMPADPTDAIAWGALIRDKVKAQKDQDLL